jgi:hypothetical protein
MEDVGLELRFPDIKSATDFGSALRDREEMANSVIGNDIRLVLREDKMNMDIETIYLIVKSVGSVVATITGFLKLVNTILKDTKGPSISISFKGTTVQIFGDADEQDLMELARVLAREE